ncbi:MAG: hypothetical protein IT179_12490 [Acidobacteria bacterium]|nr:hypothetical protein [Acidobacteriota bacterium]
MTDGHTHGRGWRALVLACCLGPVALDVPASAPAPVRGLTAADRVAAAYDAVLNADFDRMPEVLEATCGPAPRVACLGLRALGTWWEIQLDPESRALDARFSREVEAAIDGTRDWASREPERAEAWFYLGAALGARSQWKILRKERLSAARDGKQIKEALERALALDPGMHDAEFGIGVYRYYAGVAPAVFRWLRWLLLLPGGDRVEGLRQMERASRQGVIVRAEADYQRHVAYLWYERRFREALDLIVDLVSRYPRNPLFRQIDADIRSVYFSDAAGSLASSEILRELARTKRVNRAALAEVRALLNIAVQRDRLGDRPGAIEALQALLARTPTAPVDAVARARQLARAWSAR